MYPMYFIVNVESISALCSLFIVAIYNVVVVPQGNIDENSCVSLDEECKLSVSMMNFNHVLISIPGTVDLWSYIMLMDKIATNAL